jgi:putative aldouronate transport system permease protein
MYGLVISFQNYVPALGIKGSKWVGLKNLTSFISDVYFIRTLRNTLLLNIYMLVFGFPVPVLFALMLSELKSRRMTRLAQTVTYIPHFISSVVFCGLILSFVRSRGPIVGILSWLGYPRVNLLSQAGLFRSIYVTASIWQGFGWSSIIYFAALAGIDPVLYEAASIDGASRLRKIWHISLPGIIPTMVILLIMRIGSLLSLGWENIILLYNPLIYETADVISTYAYRRGLQMMEYSYGSAISLFNGVNNLILILAANAVSRRVNETSLW